MSGVCVAHLVRRGNPLAALEEFLDSYRRHPAGAAHDLLIIYKGFSGPTSVAACEALLQGTEHRRMFVSDFGFDVGPYLRAGRELPHQFFMFLNSFSRIAVPGWLELLLNHARRPGVGLVGATGSHQSPLSDSAILRGEAKRVWRHARYWVSIRGRFTPFPNPHIRTNAFLISRETLAQLRSRAPLTKWDAYRFESGEHGMTRQVIAAGLKTLVVGREGQAYEPPDWPHAKTFWIGAQQNLIVSDNQTRAYDEGSDALRARLAFFAWRRHPDGRVRDDVPPSADGR